MISHDVGVFVLVLSAIPVCRSTLSDKFTLTKFLVVLIRWAAFIGIVDCTYDHHNMWSNTFTQFGWSCSNWRIQVTGPLFRFPRNSGRSSVLPWRGLPVSEILLYNYTSFVTTQLRCLSCAAEEESWQRRPSWDTNVLWSVLLMYSDFVLYPYHHTRVCGAIGWHHHITISGAVGCVEYWVIWDATHQPCVDTVASEWLHRNGAVWTPLAMVRTLLIPGVLFCNIIL